MILGALGTGLLCLYGDPVQGLRVIGTPGVNQNIGFLWGVQTRVIGIPGVNWDIGFPWGVKTESDWDTRG